MGCDQEGGPAQNVGVGAVIPTGRREVCPEPRASSMRPTGWMGRVGDASLSTVWGSVNKETHSSWSSETQGFPQCSPQKVCSPS